MSKRTPLLLLEDILESAERILEYTKDLSFVDFCRDNRTIDAVIRNFEIIGEATHLIPDDIKEDNPGVDWHHIRGFRNRIVHDYFGVDLNILWNIIQGQLPDLITQVSIVLKKL